MDYPEELRDLTGDVKLLGIRHVAIGPYSTVYRGKLKSTEELVAIKLMHAIDGVTLHAIRRKIEREGRTWSMLQHPNILPLYGFVEDEDLFQPFGAFISPWRQRGDLAQYLAQYASGSDEPLLGERLRLWAGVVAGVTYLHSHNPVLIHGDLKPRNVLIDDDGNAQICDFGLVRVFLEEGSTGTTTTSAHTGTDRYLAYELVMAKENAIPTTASDIYATGCIGLEVIFLQTPYAYNGSNFRWYMLQAMQDGVPPAISPADLPLYLGPLWKAVGQCWARDPRSRPHARALSMNLQEISRTLDSTEIVDADTDSMIDANWATRVMRSGIWGSSEGGSVDNHIRDDGPSTSNAAPPIHIFHYIETPTPVTPKATNMAFLDEPPPIIAVDGVHDVTSLETVYEDSKELNIHADNRMVMDKGEQGGVATQPQKETRSLFAQLTTLRTNSGSWKEADIALKADATPKDTRKSSSPSTRVREFSAVILGPGGVGKSGLVLKFRGDEFLEAYNPTIEESYQRTVTIDGETSRLEILDTAGAEQFVALNELYIKNGQGFILMFSLTSQATLIEVETLRTQILRIKGDNIPIVVVGTDSDIFDERQISRDQLIKIGLQWGVPIYEVSVKKNLNVTEVFEDLLRQMRVRYPEVPRSSRKKKGVFSTRWR